MADNCTIFCSIDNPKQIFEIVRERLPEQNLIEDPLNWDKVSITTGKSCIKFARLIRIEPGDTFSKLIMGTHNKFRTIKTDLPSIQKSLLDKIGECKAIIGIVSEPEFDENEGHLDLVFSIAKKLDGIIFNGSGMIDNQGRMILDFDGKSEI